MLLCWMETVGQFLPSCRQRSRFSKKWTELGQPIRFMSSHSKKLTTVNNILPLKQDSRLPGCHLEDSSPNISTKTVRPVISKGAFHLRRSQFSQVRIMQEECTQWNHFWSCLCAHGGGYTAQRHCLASLVSKRFLDLLQVKNQFFKQRDRNGILTRPVTAVAKTVSCQPISKSIGRRFWHKPGPMFSPTKFACYVFSHFAV